MGTAHVWPVKPGGQRQIGPAVASSDSSASLGRQIPPFWQRDESQELEVRASDKADQL